MDVLLIAGFIATIIFSYLSFNKASTLKRESEHLSELLVRTINEHEQELADHKESVQELALAEARLQTLKLSTLTPDNAVPKDMHVQKVIELSTQLTDLQGQLNDMTCKFEESRGKQISERVRLGSVSENLIAFTGHFPYDRSKVKALFQPIDLIYFGEDEIVFIDIKSGGSTLSTKQRGLRDLIREGRVKFRVMRVNDKGVSWED